MKQERPAHPDLIKFLDVYDPEVVSLALALRDLVFEEASDANEVVYDGEYTVAMHFTPTARYQDAFCLVAVFPKHVNLQFNRGAELPDPKKKLEGTGKNMRHIKVNDWDDLNQPHLREFLRAALKVADYKRAVKQGGEEMNRTIVQKFDGKKQRPDGKG
jgi:hypothetical protein